MTLSFRAADTEEEWASKANQLVILWWAGLVTEILEQMSPLA